MKKSAKDKSNKNISNMDDVERQTKSCIDKILGDVSKKSASKQLLLGLSSGWYVLSVLQFIKNYHFIFF